ncbi:hypothetical protein TRVL_08155 [Trypanosoma vivax]|nr:hypothetical protein TRVL_08155 [Trypanosoma vivax]
MRRIQRGRVLFLRNILRFECFEGVSRFLSARNFHNKFGIVLFHSRMGSDFCKAWCYFSDVSSFWLCSERRLAMRILRRAKVPVLRLERAWLRAEHQEMQSRFGRGPSFWAVSRRRTWPRPFWQRGKSANSA